MASLAQMRNAYVEDGLAYEQARARAVQDAVLDLIAKSSLSKNVTIKGGVLMQHLSKDARRATTDFDLDFVRRSIANNSIKRFFNILNEGTSEFAIQIDGAIEELKHQNYSGKRIHVVVSDLYGAQIKTKIDIGVHTLMSPSLEELCFDLDKLGESITLLADSAEQVVAEKLKSLLRIGAASTRYKDIFDMYYLLIVKGVRSKELDCVIRELIFDDVTMRENSYPDIVRRLNRVLNDRRFKPQLAKAKNDWLGVPSYIVINKLIDYFS